MDPATSFQTATAALTIVDLIAKIIKRFDEYRRAHGNVPESLQSLAGQLPYLSRLFEVHDGPKTQRQSLVASKEMDTVISNCTKCLKKLEDIMDTLALKPEDNGLHILQKAFLGTKKEAKIKRIQEELGRQITILNYGKSIECHNALENLTLGSNSTTEVKLRKSYGFPATKVSNFIGRAALLSEVQSQLTAISDQRRVFVLSGMGGLGKTQFALELCEKPQIRSAFPTMFWVNANSDITTAEAFESFAHQVAQRGTTFADTQARVDFAKSTLEDFTHPFLVIFDNYDSPSKFTTLRRFFPRNAKCAILVTTRNTDSNYLGHPIEMTSMSDDEAIELLLHRSNRKIEIKAENGYAQEIVSRLGRLPLAIAQAGAFIRSRKLPLSDFMEHYDRRRSYILQYTPDVWEYGETVFTTWELSMDQVSSHDFDRNEVIQMLIFCVLLFQGNIEELSFQRLLFYARSDIKWTRMFKTNETWDPNKFQDLISILDKLTLVNILDTTHSEYNFSIHPMVCDWLKLRNDRPAISNSLHQALLILIIFIDQQPKIGVGTSTRQDIDVFILSCLRNLKDVEGLLVLEFFKSRELFEFKWRAATFLSGEGRPTLGVDLYEECLNIIGDSFDTQHPLFTTITNNLGNNYATLGRYDDAEKMFRLAINAGYVLAHVNLGVCFRQQGKVAEAQETFETALDTYKEGDGFDHPYACLCMAHLLGVYQAQGLTDKTTALLDQVSASLEGQQEAIPSVRSATYTALAKAYFGMQMFAPSETMLKRALDDVVPEYGGKHFRTVDIMISLGETYKIQGKFEEARDLFYNLTQDLEQMRAPDDPTLLILYLHYGTVLMALRKFREAQETFTKAFHGYQQCLGLGHHLVTTSFRELANATRAERNDGYKFALKFCQETMDASNASLGPTHMLTRVAAFETAITLSRQLVWSESDKCLERAIQPTESIQSGCDDLTLCAMEHLVRNRKAYGNRKDQLTACERLLSAMSPDPRCDGTRKWTIEQILLLKRELDSSNDSDSSEDSTPRTSTKASQPRSITNESPENTFTHSNMTSHAATSSSSSLSPLTSTPS
jgi:tetratricopeptide (TPR) repeat protein